MPKQDCKYWEKCYQKNEDHLAKYNHPTKQEVSPAKNNKESEQESEDLTENEGAVQTESHGKELQNVTNDEPITSVESAPKRKSSEEIEKLPQNGETDEAANNEKRPTYETTELRTEALGNIAGKNYAEILQKRIRISLQSEYDELLGSNEFLRHKFLFEMPPDFYAFWKFACELTNKSDGEQVLQQLDKQFQLQLVGPYEFLAGRFVKATIREPGDYLRHWRFFYDPPEFQTVIVRRGSGVHYGYWRDLPSEKENLLLARNDAKDSCEFEFIAGNMFDAFLYFLDKDFVGTPFTAAVVAKAKKAQQKFIETQDISLPKLAALEKARNQKVVTKTFHRAGIVVPFNAKTQLGYRALIVSDAELKKILKLFETLGGSAADETDNSVKAAVMEKLQPIATAASIALDECDFGTSLELGIDLFSSGRTELHLLVQSLLVPAYTLLLRPQFIAISKAHLEKRSKAFNLSMFELDKN